MVNNCSRPFGEGLDTNLSRRNFLKLAGVAVLASTPVLSACSPNPEATQDSQPPIELPNPEASNVQEAWEINFENMPDGGLDSEHWVFDTTSGVDDRGEKIPVPGYNGEVNAYTDRTKNVRIENGLLVLEAHKEQIDGAEYSSGRVTTKGIKDFTHGELTVRAKLPQGKGTFPAIWMLPTDPQYGEKYTGQPDFDWGRQYELNGELDIVEAVGSENGRAYGTFHTAASIESGTTNARSIDLGEELYDFHEYTIRKSDGLIELFVDGELLHTIERKQDDTPGQWPFEQSYHLIINLALGGEWAGKVDDESLPARVEVEAIKYEPLQ